MASTGSSCTGVPTGLDQGLFPAGEFTVDWNAIDPEDESNIQMAMDFGVNIPLSNTESALSVQTQEAKKAEVLLEAEEIRLRELEELEAELAEFEVWDVDGEDLIDAGPEQLHFGLVKDGDPTEKAAIVEPQDVEGMETEEPSFEFREGGDDNEEWVVTAVTGRRKALDSTGGQLPLEDRDEQFFGADVCQWEYRVRWNDHQHHHGEGPTSGPSTGTTTWERKDWLVDQGYGKLVSEYDSAKGPMKPSSTARGTRGTKPPGRLGKLTKEERKKLKEEMVARQLARQRFKQRSLQFKEVVSTLEHIPDIVKKLQFPTLNAGRDPTGYDAFLPNLLRWFFNDGIFVRCIAPVGDNIATLNRFLSATKTHQLVPVSHGTRAAALTHIAEQGLRVPGSTSGIKVANGSAYGVGIYSGITPSISRSYCGGGDTMFLCAAVRGGFSSTPDIRSTGSINVYFKEDLILPLFYIRWTDLNSPTWDPVTQQPVATRFEDLNPPGVCKTFDEMEKESTSTQVIKKTM